MHLVSSPLKQTKVLNCTYEQLTRKEIILLSLTVETLATLILLKMLTANSVVTVKNPTTSEQSADPGETIEAESAKKERCTYIQFLSVIPCI